MMSTIQNHEVRSEIMFNAANKTKFSVISLTKFVSYVSLDILQTTSFPVLLYFVDVDMMKY